VVSAAFSWLNEGLLASSTERVQCLQYVKDLGNVVLGSVQIDDEENECALPSEFDGWVFGLTARAIVTMCDDDDPGSLWKPILSMREEAHEWTARFFWYWFTDGYQSTPDTKTFMKRWSEMITFALSSPCWDLEQVQRRGLDEKVFELLGFHFGLYSVAKNPMSASALAAMLPLLDAAAQKWFSIPRVISGFARSLSEPSYDRILCHGVRWIYRALKNPSDVPFWRAHECESSLIVLSGATATE
jgi:hypothetical protein